MIDVEELFNTPAPAPTKNRSRLPGTFNIWKKRNKHVAFNTPDRTAMKEKFAEEIEQVLFHLFANNVDSRRVRISPLNFTQGISISGVTPAAIFIREDGMYYGKSKVSNLSEIPV